MIRILALSFSFIAISFELLAQSSPIKPAYERISQKYIGVFAGFGQNLQSGKMYVDCPSAQFIGGTKFGYTLGLLYEQRLFPGFLFGVSASYNYLGITSQFQEIEENDVTFMSNGKEIHEKAKIKFKNEAELDLHNFAVSPYIKWVPFEFMFVRTGLAIGTNFSTNIVHNKTLAQGTVRLSNGELAAIEVDTDDNPLQDSELLDLVSPQIFLQPALGFNIDFSESVSFSPIFEYSIPFSTVSKWGEDLKTDYWRILFELRVKISSDKM